MYISLKAVVGFCLWVACCIFADGFNVAYDRASLIINGRRKLLISGSIHYPRSTPDMWGDLIDKAKDGGLDVIETYVFWNMHEPQPRQYNFEGRLDLVKFVKLVHSKGLYVNLRIGPYIQAEWTYGGIPFWLHEIPGVTFRTTNKPFKKEMKRFTKKIVNMMKREGLYASQGGPIILQQIENEYGKIADYFGAKGHLYIDWAANMSVNLNTGVPWTMCKDADAPSYVINTCNGMYCGRLFTPNSKNAPKMWTENWTGWFSVFGGRSPQRPVEDIAYAVAQFFATQGTFVNYYMYYGGTTFGRSGGPFVIPSYDYDAPIDEYGFIRQRKWGHLKDLHVAIKLCSRALLFGMPSYYSLGLLQEAHVFETKKGECAAFLSNMDFKSDVTVQFRNLTYVLPAWSISILPDCKAVAFNTAKVSSQSNIMEMLPTGELYEGERWESFKEQIGVSGNDYFQAADLLEHINTTKDLSDYLWYTVSIDVGNDEPFLRSNVRPVLHIESRGHAICIFINGVFVGNGNGNSRNPMFKHRQYISLLSGRNNIALLSTTMGLPNSGALFEKRGAGITKVAIEGFKDGTRDLSNELWTYQVGFSGEKKQIYSEIGSNTVNWVPVLNPLQNQPMTWYKRRINAPAGNDPVALDLSSMGKGQAWINGENIGRYWISFRSVPGNCPDTCDYRGRYNKLKCESNCGHPSQKLYHVPRSLLKPTGNLLVLFEETGADPSEIAFVTRSVKSICASVSEADLPSPHLWKQLGTVPVNAKPRLQLECPKGKRISSIEFASFGNPEGECGSFRKGTCHSTHSWGTAEKVCLGQTACFMDVSSETFGDNPCVDTTKSLAVEAVCS